MTDADTRVPFRLQDPGQDDTTVSSSVLRHLSSSDDRGSGSYKLLALVFHL